MGWVKLDDGFFRNPKVLRVGRDAKALYLAGLCYSGSSLTDGFIPTNATRGLAVDIEIGSPKKAIAQLVDAGLWVEVGDGFMIHDYLEFNQSAEKVHAIRDAAKDRMHRSRSQNVRANNDERSQDVRAKFSRSSQNVREPEEIRRDTETEEGVNPHTPTTDDSPPTQSVSIHEQRFERFWETYPKRVGKDAALKWWIRTKPDDAFMSTIIAAIGVQRASSQWLKDGGQFIPNPVTWLNQGRWKDDPEPDVPAGNVTPFQGRSGSGRNIGLTNLQLEAIARGDA